MAQGDILKRYFDAGLEFTQMTRERAEAIVQDLVKAGEVRRKEADKRIEELVERSRKNTDALVAIIRREVSEQLANLGLGDLAARVGPGDDTAHVAPAYKAAAAKKSGTKKAGVAKKAGAKKASPAKKSTKKSGS